MTIGLICLSVFSYAMEINTFTHAMHIDFGAVEKKKSVEEEALMGPEKYAYAVIARLREEQNKPGSKIITDTKPQQERKFGRGFSGLDAKL